MLNQAAAQLPRTPFRSISIRTAFSEFPASRSQSSSSNPHVRYRSTLHSDKLARSRGGLHYGSPDLRLIKHEQQLRAVNDVRQEGRLADLRYGCEIKRAARRKRTLRASASFFCFAAAANGSKEPVLAFCGNAANGCNFTRILTMTDLRQSY